MRLNFGWEEEKGIRHFLIVDFENGAETHVLRDDDEDESFDLDEVVEYYHKWCLARGMKILQNEENTKALERARDRRPIGYLSLKVGLRTEKGEGE